MEVRHLRRPFPPPPLGFSLILCVVVPRTHRWHPPKIWPNPKYHNEALIFVHLARASGLLAAYLLLLACYMLARPIRSTLHTNGAYKTKIGSTSSVTLTLTLTLTTLTQDYPSLRRLTQVYHFQDIMVRPS